MSVGEAIRFDKRDFQSRLMGNSRSVWIQSCAHHDRAPAGILLFLDAEYYLTHVAAPNTVDALEKRRSIPNLLPVYVSSVDSKTRWTESFCNRRFVEFLSDELVPWISGHHGVDGSADNVITGLSLTGLAAAHAALVRPDVFPRVVSQSGSFWWEDCRLANEVSNGAAMKSVFRISVGDEETDENVDHGDGLIQRDSQVSGCRRMRDALLANGHDCSYDEFSGSHDILVWRTDLADSLIAVHSFAAN